MVGILLEEGNETKHWGVIQMKPYGVYIQIIIRLELKGINIVMDMSSHTSLNYGIVMKKHWYI